VFQNGKLGPLKLARITTPTRKSRAGVVECQADTMRRSATKKTIKAAGFVRGGTSRDRTGNRIREQNQSLAQLAYNQIEELIVTLTLAPGTTLYETILCEDLKMGRTPVREALQRLAHDKLITIIPRRGTFVTEIDARDQLKLVELRREVERLIVRCAARRATAEQRGEFLRIADELERAADEGDDVGFLRLDRRLKPLLGVAARNEYAAAGVASWHSLSRRFWYYRYKRLHDVPIAARLHAAVARTVAAGDELVATAALDRLIDYVEDFSRCALDDA